MWKRLSNERGMKSCYTGKGGQTRRIPDMCPVEVKMKKKSTGDSIIGPNMKMEFTTTTKTFPMRFPEEGKTSIRDTVTELFLQLALHEY